MCLFRFYADYNYYIGSCLGDEQERSDIRTSVNLTLGTCHYFGMVMNKLNKLDLSLRNTKHNNQDFSMTTLY